MSTSLAYHTQGIIGFQHKSFDFSEKKVIQCLEKTEHRCPKCFNLSVSAYPIRERQIQAMPYGSKQTYFKVTIHRIYCPKCKAAFMEELPFLSHPEARLTTTFERTIVDLRPDMTISAISRHYHVPWHTIKTIEKRYLKHKYRKISLKNVRVIGIDEIAIGHIAGHKPAYWSIVRDLESGAVLHVDKGKDGDSLQDFLKKIRRSKAKIELVAMDMGRAFIAWVTENLPDAKIVFDHFHVIKLMNDILDKARRRTMAQLDDDQRSALKNKRFVLLHNEEDLDADAAKDLAVIKDHFKELADLHMMKESLRSIYRVVDNPWEAEVSLEKWCKQSLSLDSAYLGKMVKCLQQHWEGVLGFWKYDNLTNAGMEGFNNKVRTMIRQAYGFRDEEYMRLKIFDLPNKRVNDGI